MRGIEAGMVAEKGGRKVESCTRGKTRYGREKTAFRLGRKYPGEKREFRDFI
jgi:hypothetical protein